MIRPIVRKIANSIVRSIVNASSLTGTPEPVVQWQLVLDGTNYANLSQIEFVGDYEFEFSINSTASIVAFYSLLGYSGVDNNFVRIHTNGTIQLYYAGAYKAQSTINTFKFDGLDHVIRITRSGDTSKIYYDTVEVASQIDSITNVLFNQIGTKDDGADPFDGIIRLVRLTDLAIPANSLSWILDSASITREPSEEYPADPTKDLIYHNVTSDDWVQV